jgi:CRP-like cAMP-binding protein
MALIEERPRAATAVATQATTCIVITAMDLKDRLQQSDPLVRALVRALSVKLRKATG